MSHQLSQYGVGAKHAATYLGDGFAVISKQSRAPVVYELALSVSDMVKRDKEGSKVQSLPRAMFRRRAALRAALHMMMADIWLVAS